MLALLDDFKSVYTVSIIRSPDKSMTALSQTHNEHWWERSRALPQKFWGERNIYNDLARMHTLGRLATPTI